MYVLIGSDTDIEMDVDRALARFDEDLPVRRYKLRLAVSAVRDIARHYHLPAKNLPALAEKLPEWMACRGGVDELGLFAWRTDNPDGKWDWYEIGGRWDGYVVGRPKLLNEMQTCAVEDNSILAADLLKAADFDRRLPGGMVTPTGEWIERSTFVMTASGWYCTECPARKWHSRVRRILEAFPAHRVVCVDVHY